MMHSHGLVNGEVVSVSEVLILVVMDDALALQGFETKGNFVVGLNPCCSG